MQVSNQRLQQIIHTAPRRKQTRKMSELSEENKLGCSKDQTSRMRNNVYRSSEFNGIRAHKGSYREIYRSFNKVSQNRSTSSSDDAFGGNSFGILHG